MRGVAFVLLLLVAVATCYDYSAGHSCAVCKAVEAGAPCERFSACHVVSRDKLGGKTCEEAGLCDSTTDELRASGFFDLRVTKGFGTKPYDALRLSVVTENGHEPAGFDKSGFEYSAQFKYKWTDNSLHSTMVHHPSPGHNATFHVGGQEVVVRLPKAGDGISGVLIGDPCVRYSSITSLLACTYADKFHTKERTPAMLNLLMKDNDFYAILGDNFYDQHGKTTRQVFSELTPQTKSRILLTVPGNHDYWILGTPGTGTEADQFANGHMQWYAMDSKAAEALTPGRAGNTGVAPFNFSINPDKGHFLVGGNEPEISNSFWYNQVGNVGFVGQSGAYPLSKTLPLMREACQWLSDNHRSKGGTIDVGVLVGHWDVTGMGCDKSMDMPGFYDEMSKLPGCAELDTKGVLKFFMGHTHCNVPHPHGKVNTGFMVAGQGMEGCGNYGFPIFDTTENRLRVYHFEVVAKNGTDSYNAIHSCITEKGWRGCTSLAQLWLDQPLPKL